MIEQTIAAAPKSWKPWFYRTGAGAEIDLILEQPGKRRLLAFDVSIAGAPRLTKGFLSALEDVKPAEAFVVCRAGERYPIAKRIEALPMERIREVLAGD